MHCLWDPPVKFIESKGEKPIQGESELLRQTEVINKQHLSYKAGLYATGKTVDVANIEYSDDCERSSQALSRVQYFFSKKSRNHLAVKIVF